MTRDALTPVELPGFGDATADITPTALTAANGAEFVNTGRELLVAYNGDAGSQNLTITGVAGVKNFNQAKAITESVAAGKTIVLGPFDPAVYNRTGDVAANSVLFDVVTNNWTAFVVRLPLRN